MAQAKASAGLLVPSSLDEPPAAEQKGHDWFQKHSYRKLLKGLNWLVISSSLDSGTVCANPTPTPHHLSNHPGGNLGANLKPISHRCHFRKVAFERELTEETIYLPLGCFQGGNATPRYAVFVLHVKVAPCDLSGNTESVRESVCVRERESERVTERETARARGGKRRAVVLI
jgi:hypothetical protein